MYVGAIVCGWAKVNVMAGDSWWYSIFVVSCCLLLTRPYLGAFKKSNKERENRGISFRQQQDEVLLVAMVVHI